MAKDREGYSGVWRTIRGAHVFIRDGEDLESAMKRSGKFKTKLSSEETENLRKAGREARAREIDKINKISQEEYDKTPKDYKGTLKELVDTAEFRGENKEELRTFYEKQGYDVDNDKTILKYDNGGTVLQPVKIDDKYSTSEHIGFGDYNKDKIPVYNNKIDYTGDFTRGDLKTLSNEELTTALNKQSELYHQASDENLGDQRTRNGRMNKIFNTAKLQQYEGGMKAISEEMEKRDLPRYNIYDDAGNIRVSSPTKEMAERELAEIYETDKSLQKTYGWKELPKYSIKEGKVDEYLNERKDTGEQTIPREKAQSFVKAFKTALEEEQKGYTQTVDWDGGTYQYSQDRLNRMEESGIKPLEHSYTGGGWQGTKYDSKLTTKEIAKTVQSDLKKEFPDVKISRKTDYNSIDINIMSSKKDLFASSSDIDKMSDSQVSDTIRDSIGGYTRMDDWLNQNNRKSANGTYTVNDERDYLKEELETYRNRQGYRVTGDEWYLSDYGKQVVGSLNKNLNSYNYDDSDGMVDYFDTNFYGGVQIGKWDKPYSVESSKQNTSLSKMSISELRNMANDYGINTKGKSKNQLLSALISMFNK